MAELLLEKGDATYLLAAMQANQDSLEEVWGATWLDKKDRDEEYNRLQRLIAQLETLVEEEDYLDYDYEEDEEYEC